MSLSLLGQLEKSGSHCLGASASELSQLLAGAGELESSDDAQLLLTLSFREPSKVAALALASSDDGRAPKTVKLFVNVPHIDFAQADDEPPTQTFVLWPAGSTLPPPSSDVSVRNVLYASTGSGTLTAELPLHYVKWQKTTSLSLFVVDNLGDEDTSVLRALDVLSGEKPTAHVAFVATEKDFDKLLADAGTKAVFVDFTAGWCGPCKLIAPVFQKLSEENADAVFVKVDVDANQAVARKFGVASMPTFIAFKSAAKVGQMSGADEAKLREFVAQHK
jgi:thioredoxin 1